VNRIYVTAYAPSFTDLGNDVIAALSAVPLLNRNFKWYEPEIKMFWLTITGAILTDVVKDEAKTAIQKALSLAYGMDSTSRRKQVLTSELYAIIKSTGYFEDSSGAHFAVTSSGTPSADNPYEMICIDMEKTTVDLSYV